MRSQAIAVAQAALAACAGCAGAPPREPPPSPPPAAGLEAPAPSFSSPARWGYHPSPPDEAIAALRLPDGGCLLIAEGGQRWVVTPKAPPDADADAAAVCAGAGTPSSAPAPEELSGLARRTATSWLFFGERGTIYESATPLGPFVRTTPPPVPLARIAGAPGALLAVTQEGGVLRWDEREGAWKEAPLVTAPPAPPAPAAGAPRPWAFDVVAGEGGRALALALPEALFTSEDGGATWARASSPPAGLWRLGALPGGELLAEGPLASISWDPRRPAPFARVQAGLPPPLQATVEVGRAPAAAAVRAGRAAISGVRYVEVVRPEMPETPWTLVSSSIDGASAAPRPIPGTEACGSLKIGAAGRSLAAVCVRGEDEVILAEVLRSDDAGATWSPAAKLETPHVDGIGLAVSPGGAVLITGVCKQGDAGPGSAAGSSGECRPSAPVLIRLEGDRAVTSLAAAPTLGTLAALPAFSIDGRSAYFVGFRVKDDRLALFVSHDGGETFSPRPLARGEPRERPAEEGEEPERPPEHEEGEEPREGGGFEATEDSALVPAEDGVVGLLLADSGQQVLVTTDDDGRVLSVASPPAEGAMIGLTGRRALAIAPEDPERGGSGAGGGPIRLWESLDGGATWSDLPPTPALGHDFFRGASAVACGVAGCLLGDTVTRVGWGGQVEGPAPSAPEPPRREPAARTPIVCELKPGAAWTRVEHSVAGSWGMPTANELMRGRAVWSVLTNDPRGAVATVAAMLPEAGGEAKMVTRPLLPAPPAGARTALNISLQMEGYAAARLKLPGAPGTPIPPGSPMRDVEVAWENWMDGISGRAKIADAGQVEVGDVRPAAGDAYDPELLSVSLRGIFVRPHAEGALTLFLEPPGRGKLARFEYPTWPAAQGGRRLDVRSDAVFADGRPLGVGMVRIGEGSAITTMLLAHRRDPADPWSIEAVAVAPPASGVGLAAHTDWTYGGGQIGVTTVLAHAGRGRGWAVFQAFRGDGTLGAAQPLPTPFDLPDPPRPCNAAERASTARLEAPMFLRGDALFPGTRHPVLVLDAGSPTALGQSMTLLTSSVVLHGTPAAPCVAGWEANALGGAPAVALIPGDLVHSWLFRAVPSGDRSTFEVRPMACRFEPAAKIPEQVWSEPAMSRAVP